MNNQQINFNKFKYYMKIWENVVFLFFYLFVIIFLQFTAFQYNTVVQPGSQVCFFFTNFDSTKYWSNQLVHTGHQANVLRDPGCCLLTLSWLIFIPSAPIALENKDMG